MHLDLLHEHDRFIPGWHHRPEPSSMRAEWTRPEWRWPSRLMEFLASLPSMVIGWRAAGPRRGPNTAVTEADRNGILDGTSVAL